MNRRTLAITIAAFTAFGVGTLLLIQRVSDRRTAECGRTCEQKGLAAVALPPGTIASSVEGGRTILEVGNECRCVAPSNTERATRPWWRL